VNLTEPEIGAAIVAFVRVAGLVVAAPVIGDLGVPMRARLVAAVAIAFAVSANRPGVVYADVPAVAIIELGYGLLTGLSARFILARLATAGQLIGLALGLGFATEFDKNAGESAGIIRTMLVTLGGLAFIHAGGFDMLVRAAAGSPATVPDLVTLVPQLLSHGTSALAAGVTIAAPILVAAVIANIGLAVASRAVPAVNAFSVSLAATLFVGAIALVVSAPALVGSIEEVARTAAETLR